MQIHARFRLEQVNRMQSHYKPEGAHESKQVESAYVQLGAVQGEPFGSATPSGRIEMHIVNPMAAAEFHKATVGQEYDVVFTPRKKE